MNSVRAILTAILTRGRHLLYRFAPVVLAAYLWLLTSPVALAAKKKAVEAAPTKSYTMPYLIVIVLVGVGLMTVMRPSSRLDQPLDMNKKDEKEES
jgi:hypothetical protein